MTHGHIPMVLRDEHHWCNNDCFAPFFDQCVSDLISPTLAHLSCSAHAFTHFQQIPGGANPFGGMITTRPPPLRMEEHHSNVVSGNQIMLSLCICFRCSWDDGSHHQGSLDHVDLENVFQRRVYLMRSVEWPVQSSVADCGARNLGRCHSTGCGGWKVLFLLPRMLLSRGKVSKEKIDGTVGEFANGRWIDLVHDSEEIGDLSATAALTAGKR